MKYRIIYFASIIYFGYIEPQHLGFTEIELAPNKVSSMSSTQKEVDEGSYDPVPRLEYDSNREAISILTLALITLQTLPKAK